MLEVSEPYDRVSSGFGARVRAVAPEQWSMPGPCAEWTVRALVGHVVTTHWRVEGTSGRETDPTGDLVAEWCEARTALQAALADPQRAEQVVGGMFGEQSFESLVSRLLCADTLFHTWDLARATGQSEGLDADAVAVALEFLTPLDEVIRRPGGFAPKITPSPDADLQTRLLYFGGRIV